MKTVIIEDHGPVAVLRLDNGKTNAINGQLVHDMQEALTEISTQYQGMVWPAGKSFSPSAWTCLNCCNLTGTL